MNSQNHNKIKSEKQGNKQCQLDKPQQFTTTCGYRREDHQEPKNTQFKKNFFDK